MDLLFNTQQSFFISKPYFENKDFLLSTVHSTLILCIFKQAALTLNVYQ